jgi:hypothetical protein
MSPRAVWLDRLLKWIEPEDNPRGTVYGTISAGLVIAAEDPATETFLRVLLATVVAVATYWLAHGYAHWFGERFRSESNPTPSASRLVGALLHEWPIAEGAAIPVAALLVGWAAGMSLATAVVAAVWTAAAALVVFEVAGGLRRRLPARYLLTNAVIGLVLGSALFAVKLLLH